MAWVTLRDLETNDIVLESDMDGIKGNIEYNRSPLADEVLNSADFTTSSATFVDVTGAEVTISLTGTTARVVCMGSLKVTTIGHKAVINISVDGTDVTTDADAFVFTVDSQNGYAFCVVYTVTGLTAGSHTFKMRAKNVGGSQTYVYNPSIQVIDGA